MMFKQNKLLVIFCKVVITLNLINHSFQNTYSMSGFVFAMRNLEARSIYDHLPQLFSVFSFRVEHQLFLELNLLSIAKFLPQDQLSAID